MKEFWIFPGNIAEDLGRAVRHLDGYRDVRPHEEPYHGTVHLVMEAAQVRELEELIGTGENLRVMVGAMIGQAVASALKGQR